MRLVVLTLHWEGAAVLQPGATLRERYRIETVIFTGGLEAAYRASDSGRGGCFVRVQEIAPRFPDEDVRADVEARFRREAGRLSTLIHPGLAPLVEAFEADDRLYLVTDLGNAVPLGDLPAGTAVPQILAWAEELCDVLDYLHRQTPPVLYHYLGPGSVLRDESGHLRLAELGLAHILDGPLRTAAFHQGSGTPGFIPMEQYDGSPLDARADIYALGALLYYLAGGTAPPPSIALWTNHAALRSLTALNPAVPPFLESAILTMMATQKDERFASIERVREALGKAEAAPPQCGSCGSTALRDARWCPRCGAPLPSSGVGSRDLSRSASPSPPARAPRPAWVLFLDIAGYSTLRNDRQIQLRAQLDQMLRQLPCLAGMESDEYYCDVRAGDSGVVVFYRDLRGPIEAALSISDEVAGGVRFDPQMRLRMGLHFGTVLVEADGSPVGDAVNMGQRVAAAGKPGEITASATYVEMLTANSDRYDALLGPPRQVEVKHGKLLTMVRVASPQHGLDEDTVPLPSLELNRSTAPPTPPPRPAAAPQPSAPAARDLPQVATPDFTLVVSGMQLRVVGGAATGSVVPLAEREVQIGRGPVTEARGDRVSFADPTVSRLQALIRYDSRRQLYTLHHEPRAANPTLVNDRPIKRQVLKSGDVVRMGHLAFVFEPMRPD